MLGAAALTAGLAAGGVIAAGAADDPQSVFLQYGAIGAALLVVGWFAWWVIRRREADWQRERDDLCEQRDTERARADRLEGELRTLNATTFERMSAMTNTANAALERAHAALTAAWESTRRAR